MTDMNTTANNATKIRLTRDGDAYKFTCDKFTANIWKFESAYGDMQWGCDIIHNDNMHHGVDDTYCQFDYLDQVRTYIGHLIAA